MNKPIYQCNNCNKFHYSLESLISCECKFKGKGKIKWNSPIKHSSNEDIKRIWLK